MNSSRKSAFQQMLPWTESPLICSAPMRGVSGAALAVAVSGAGGLGFIGGGNDVSDLESKLQEAQRLIRERKTQTTSQNDNWLLLHESATTLPIGVGFINWGADLDVALPLIGKYRPVAVWLFAPRNGASELRKWAESIRTQTHGTVSIWVQVGDVADAIDAVDHVKPDVLVLQGSDGGGHGLVQSGSILSLVPETIDRLAKEYPAGQPRSQLPKIFAAGGLVDGRGAAAAFVLGAEGVAMGTRFLASFESDVSNEYRQAIVDTQDGGKTTVRHTVFDTARGTAFWPEKYAARGVINKTYDDCISGKLTEAENYDRYQEDLKTAKVKYGIDGRIDTFAGTAVGLIRGVLPAGDIVRSVRQQTNMLLNSRGSSKL